MRQIIVAIDGTMIAAHNSKSWVDVEKKLRAAASAAAVTNPAMAEALGCRG
jgi:hypothetical protein